VHRRYAQHEYACGGIHYHGTDLQNIHGRFMSSDISRRHPDGNPAQGTYGEGCTST